MILNLSSEQMLAQWRRRRWAEPELPGGVVSRLESDEFTAHMEDEMRAWFLALLDRGDLRFIVPTDVTDRVVACRLDADGLEMLRVKEPSDDVRAILSVSYMGWLAPQDASATMEQVRARAANPFWRRPAVAAIDSRSVMVCAADGGLTSVMAIVDPGPTRYILDDSALSLITPKL